MGPTIRYFTITGEHVEIPKKKPSNFQFKKLQTYEDFQTFLRKSCTQKTIPKKNHSPKLHGFELKKNFGHRIQVNKYAFSVITNFFLKIMKRINIFKQPAKKKTTIYSTRRTYSNFFNR